MGYGVGVGSYGARPDGVAMKREEEEMSLSFSVHEEEEEEAEAEEEMGSANGGRSSERRKDGMEWRLMRIWIELDSLPPRKSDERLFSLFDPANPTQRLGRMFFPCI